MKRWLSRHWLVLLVLVTILAVYQLPGLGCPIRALLGFPCPACGMTRALWALLRLDLSASLAYHPLMLPVFAAVLLSLHRGHIPVRWRRWVDGFAIVTGVLTLAFWLWRLASIFLV